MHSSLLYSGRTSVGRQYVSTEFDGRRISVIVHRSASDKLAVESFTRLACYGPSQRERKSVWQGSAEGFQSLPIINHYPPIPPGPCSSKSRFIVVYWLYIWTVGCLLGNSPLGEIPAGAKNILYITEDPTEERGRVEVIRFVHIVWLLDTNHVTLWALYAFCGALDFKMSEHWTKIKLFFGQLLNYSACVVNVGAKLVDI